MRRGLIVSSHIDVFRSVTVRAPMPLVFARVGVEHDDAVVAIAVSDVDLVRLLVDERLGRQPEILDVVAALALAGLPDL